MDYPGVQANVGQTLSCPSEKDCEPSHAKTCLLGTQGSVKVVRKPCKR